MTGIQFRAPASFRRGGGRWLVPPWIAPAFALCVVVLVPWSGYLFGTLPPHYSANHWRIAWGGFDVGLALALAATATLIVRRSPLVEVTATVTGTLLLCDAWFDVLTSRGTSAVAQSIVEALLVELPLAGLCFWIARNLAHAIESARPYLLNAGFTIQGNKLVGPSDT
jgi:hypothetical protein